MEGVPRVETKKPEEARVTKDIINQVQQTPQELWFIGGVGKQRTSFSVKEKGLSLSNSSG